jgi:hypothetical protein
MAKKAASAPKKTNRESDKFMLRLPDGMRKAMAHAAETNSRSMNSEIVERLARSFERSVDPQEIARTLERIAGAADILNGIFFGPENVALNAFISEQRAKGTTLTRNEAICYIVNTWLAENGYVEGYLFGEVKKGNR